MRYASSFSTRRGPLAVAAVVLALVGCSAVAVAQLSGADAADPLQRPNTAITAVEADQAASFAVLRGDAGSPATLSEAASGLVERGLGPDVGASATLARAAVQGVDGYDRYVVPGHGWICLVSADGHGGCNRTAAVASGYGLGAYRDGDVTVLEGLVPDGASAVEVVGGAGSAVLQVAAQANVWTARVTFTPASVRWTGADGVPHDVPVGQTPGGPVGPVPGG